jgi:hypothetical protein
MNVVRVIAVMTILTIGAIVVGVGPSWPTSVAQITALIGGAIVFSCAIYVMITAFKPTRRLPFAIVAIVAGVAGGAGWWLFGGKQTSLVNASLFGGMLALVGFLQDMWSFPSADPKDHEVTKPESGESNGDEASSRT